MVDRNLSVVDTQSTDFTQLVKNLQEYVKAKPQEGSWKDFYPGSTGQTIIELIAGLGVYNLHHITANRKESYLGEASMGSSVRELAINKGALVPPSKCAKMKLLVRPTGEEVKTVMGTTVGFLGDYDLVTTQDIIWGPQAIEIEVSVGILLELHTKISPKPFKRITLLHNYQYSSRDAEELLINEVKVSMKSSLNHTDENRGEFLLRRVEPGEVILYLGNGDLGYYSPQATDIKYTTIAYNDDISSMLELTPIATPQFIIDNYELTEPPAFAPSTDEIRGYALYLPLDGRVVTDTDYMTTIMQYYGGVLHDCYSFNTDPDEQIYLLTDASLWSSNQLVGIKKLINSKRALAIPVYYFEVDPSQGKVVDLQLVIADKSFYTTHHKEVIAYIRNKQLKFFRVTTQFKPHMLATELSAKFNTQISSRVCETVEMQPTDFIRQFNITISTEE